MLTNLDGKLFLECVKKLQKLQSPQKGGDADNAG